MRTVAEVNLHYQACPRERPTHGLAVFVSSRTPFRGFYRLVENVSIFVSLSLIKCLNRFNFQMYL